MAIRKPSYKLAVDPFLENKVMNILKELDVPKVEVKDGKLYYGDQLVVDSLNDDYAVLNTPSHTDFSTPVPGWATEENGCVPHKAIKVGNGIIVEYKPMHTLGVGYAKIYIVGKDNQPFPRMKEIWEETHRNWCKGRKHNPQAPIEGTIAPTGEIRDQYGSVAPSFDAMHKFLLSMNLLYSNWKYFPDATSYEKVEKLKQALEDVRTMDGSANYIENDIKDLREQIKSKQDEIANREKQLNDLYERAADAMNLLEENGVKVDAKGKIEGVEDDGSEFITTLGPPGEYYIDSSSLTPFISTGTGYSPISICKPEYDQYWAEGHEYDCATSGHCSNGKKTR